MCLKRPNINEKEAGDGPFFYFENYEIGPAAHFLPISKTFIRKLPKVQNFVKSAHTVTDTHTIHRRVCVW